MDDKLKYALIIAFVLNSAFVLSNFQNRTYDSFEHIFFASHYQKSWFNSWEPKWYGGFTLTSYPPLAHQTIAFLGFAVGLEWAYKILTLALMTILPLAIYKFSKVFVSEKAAVYAGFISVFLPSILQATYSWGQLPTLFGLVAGLFAIAYLSKFLVLGRWLNLAIALGFLGIAVSAHHFTAVFFIPVLVFVLTLDLLLRRKEIAPRVVLRRVALFAAAGIVLSLTLIYPFWLFSLFNNVNMSPIMHLSRANILADQLGFELFFWNMYGSILFLIPFCIVPVVKNKRLVVLFLGAMVLFVLGLGGSTPFPKILFGSYWEILTYDRFGLWASVLFLPLIGKLFLEYRTKIKAHQILKLLLIAFFATLVLIGVYASDRSLSLPIVPNISTIDPVIEFLNSSQTQNWRYLTLGLGEPLMLKLSVYANASNVDGYYYFVRSAPLLAQSGIGALDNAKFYGDQGFAILGEVLGNATKYSLRWVICGDPTYYVILQQNGFVERWTQDTTGDIRFGGTSIWEYNQTVPDYVQKVPERSIMSDYVWGIGPPSVFLVTLLLVAIERLRKRDERRNETLEEMGTKKRKI
jgi:hypothetical protein